MASLLPTCPCWRYNTASAESSDGCTNVAFFVFFFLQNLQMQYSDAVVSTVAWEREGRGFNSRAAGSVSSFTEMPSSDSSGFVCVSFCQELCLCQSKDTNIRLSGSSKMSVGVKVCAKLGKNRWLVQCEIPPTPEDGYYYHDSHFFQITTPSFPVVVKIGHAHSGMGKVILQISFSEFPQK